MAPADTPDAGAPEDVPEEVQAPPMVMSYPTRQNIVDLFEGEWSSQLPPGSGLVSSGKAELFDDARVRWAEEKLGPIENMDVLELGPLEGGHSYLLHWFGARSITSIEANSRAFLRLLCVKELLEITTLHPMLGDFLAWLREEQHKRFDLVFASGVLYHMPDPLELLDLVCGVSDRLFLWSHYYDDKLIAAGSDAVLFGPPEIQTRNDFSCLGARRDYPQAALAWRGFSGGPKPFATWLTQDGILGFLRHRGMTKIEVAFDHPDHPNGPAFAIAARRPGEPAGGVAQPRM